LPPPFSAREQIRQAQGLSLGVLSWNPLFFRSPLVSGERSPLLSSLPFRRFFFTPSPFPSPVPSPFFPPLPFAKIFGCYASNVIGLMALPHVSHPADSFPWIPLKDTPRDLRFLSYLPLLPSLSPCPETPPPCSYGSPWVFWRTPLRTQLVTILFFLVYGQPSFNRNYCFALRFAALFHLKNWTSSSGSSFLGAPFKFFKLDLPSFDPSPSLPFLRFFPPSPARHYEVSTAKPKQPRPDPHMTSLRL